MRTGKKTCVVRIKHKYCMEKMQKMHRTDGSKMLFLNIKVAVWTITFSKPFYPIKKTKMEKTSNIRNLTHTTPGEIGIIDLTREHSKVSDEIFTEIYTIL